MQQFIQVFLDVGSIMGLLLGTAVITHRARHAVRVRLAYRQYRTLAAQQAEEQRLIREHEAPTE